MDHEVTINLKSKFILNKDIEIEVKADAKKLGTLLVSKGNIEWLPVGNSVNKKRLSWTKFAALLESEGKAVKASASATRSAKKKTDTEFGDFSKPTLAKAAKKAPRKAAKKISQQIN